MNKFLNENPILTFCLVIILSLLALCGFNLYKLVSKSQEIRIKQSISSVILTKNKEIYRVETLIIDNYHIVNFQEEKGTFKQLDSLKCIQYNEAKKIVDILNLFKEKKCN